MSKKRIRNAYHKEPIFFEHGGIGQTVYHAHIHALPFPNDTDTDMFDACKKDFPHNKELISLYELMDIWKTKGQYVFYETCGNMYAFFTNIKPMYGRIAVANALGVPERANWRTMDKDLDAKLIQETLRKLK